MAQQFVGPIYYLGDKQTGKKSTIDLFKDATGRVLAQDRKSRLKVYGELVRVNQVSEIPDTALGVMLFYDITRQTSFRVVADHCRVIQQRVENRTSIWPVRVLIGTHRDQSDNRQVSYEDAVQLRNMLDLIWFEIAVGKTKTNVQTLKTQMDIRMVYAVRELLENRADIPAVPLSRMNTPAEGWGKLDQVKELLNDDELKRRAIEQQDRVKTQEAEKQLQLQQLEDQKAADSKRLEGMKKQQQELEELREKQRQYEEQMKAQPQPNQDGKLDKQKELGKYVNEELEAQNNKELEQDDLEFLDQPTPQAQVDPQVQKLIDQIAEQQKFIAEKEKQQEEKEKFEREKAELQKQRAEELKQINQQEDPMQQLFPTYVAQQSDKAEPKSSFFKQLQNARLLGSSPNKVAQAPVAIPEVVQQQQNQAPAFDINQLFSRKAPQQEEVKQVPVTEPLNMSIDESFQTEPEIQESVLVDAEIQPEVDNLEQQRLKEEEEQRLAVEWDRITEARQTLENEKEQLEQSKLEFSQLAQSMNENDAKISEPAQKGKVRAGGQNDDVWLSVNNVSLPIEQDQQPIELDQTELDRLMNEILQGRGVQEDQNQLQEQRSTGNPVVEQQFTREKPVLEVMQPQSQKPLPSLSFMQASYIEVLPQDQIKNDQGVEESKQANQQEEQQQVKDQPDEIPVDKPKDTQQPVEKNSLENSEDQQVPQEQNELKQSQAGVISPSEDELDIAISSPIQRQAANKPNPKSPEPEPVAEVRVKEPKKPKKIQMDIYRESVVAQAQEPMEDHHEPEPQKPLATEEEIQKQLAEVFDLFLESYGSKATKEELQAFVEKFDPTKDDFLDQLKAEKARLAMVNKLMKRMQPQQEEEIQKVAAMGLDELRSSLSRYSVDIYDKFNKTQQQQPNHELYSDLSRSQSTVTEPKVKKQAKKPKPVQSSQQSSQPVDPEAANLPERDSFSQPKQLQHSGSVQQQEVYEEEHQSEDNAKSTMKHIQEQSPINRNQFFQSPHFEMNNYGSNLNVTDSQQLPGHSIIPNLFTNQIEPLTGSLDMNGQVQNPYDRQLLYARGSRRYPEIYGALVDSPHMIKQTGLIDRLIIGKLQPVSRTQKDQNRALSPAPAPSAAIYRAAQSSIKSKSPEQLHQDQYTSQLRKGLSNTRVPHPKDIPSQIKIGVKDSNNKPEFLKQSTAVKPQSILSTQDLSQRSVQKTSNSLNRNIDEEPVLCIEFEHEDHPYRLNVRRDDNAFFLAKQFVEENGLPGHLTRKITAAIIEKLKSFFEVVQQEQEYSRFEANKSQYDYVPPAMTRAPKADILFKFELTVERYTKVIAVRSGDTAQQLADDYCRTFSLKRERYFDLIVNKVQEYIAIFYMGQQ